MMQGRFVEGCQYWSSQWSRQCCPSRRTYRRPPRGVHQWRLVEVEDRKQCSVILSFPTKCADPQWLRHHRNAWVLHATFLDLVHKYRIICVIQVNNRSNVKISEQLNMASSIIYKSERLHFIFAKTTVLTVNARLPVKTKTCVPMQRPRRSIHSAVHTHR